MRVRTHRSISTFFVTYVIITGVVLMNVVVAVLLDEFIECITEEKEHNAALKKAKDEQAFEAMRVYGYMDPILRNMCRFTTQEDFVEKIDKLFATLDKDGNGELDFSELRNGLKAMKFTPAVIIKEDEYEMLSHHRTLCNRCVCVCVRACVRACVCACVRVCAHTHTHTSDRQVRFIARAQCPPPPIPPSVVSNCLVCAC